MNALGPRAQMAPLFADASERRHWDDFLTAALGASVARMATGAVSPDGDMAAFHDALATFDFAAPRPLVELLPWVIERLEHGVTHLTHPRYFGLFNPQPAFAAELAERITAAFNPQLATARTSPVPVALEAHVIRAVAARAGLPAHVGGHFTTGGSEANFSALACALTAAAPGFAQDGVAAFAGAPVFYVSADAHAAWHKIAHQSGIGRKALRAVAVDAAGRMDGDALEAMIDADRAAGCVPVMLVATAGTTGAGMIDPLARCAAIARAEKIWFHVDAAWGGAVVASARLRPLLDGIQAADSVTIDAHKWFATTMGCGMFFCARPGVLAQTFHAGGSYMPSNDPSQDPYVTTFQWSRRFLGLRLFLTLASVGWDGVAAHVEQAVGLVADLRDMLRAGGWEIANRSALGVLCVVPPAGRADVATIVARIVASGEAWIASTQFGGRSVLRICVTHGQTGRDDILALATLLKSAANSVFPIPERSTTR